MSDTCLLRPESPYDLLSSSTFFKKYLFPQYHGFILYRTVLKESYLTPATLSVRGVRDRAMVMIDSVSNLCQFFFYYVYTYQMMGKQEHIQIFHNSYLACQCTTKTEVLGSSQSQIY